MLHRIIDDKKSLPRGIDSSAQLLSSSGDKKLCESEEMQLADASELPRPLPSVFSSTT
jgi:hypothetical protein